MDFSQEAYGDQRSARCLQMWREQQTTRMEAAYARLLGHGDTRQAEIFRHATEALIKGNAAPVEMLARMNKTPVLIDEFVESPEFLGELMEVWPALKDDLREMNPDVLAGAEPVTEVLLGGATGTGKSFLSSITAMYQLYLLTCFDEPQRMFGMAATTPIVFTMQSVSPTITKRVLYKPMRDIFVAMPFTKQHLRYNRHKESELEIGGGLKVVPIGANVQSIVGQAIPCAILDEVNFMQVIENSKQVAGPNGMGGHYDQAEDVYSNISRRRKRTFLTQGYSFGALCVISSTRYKDDFLDRRMAEAEKHNESGVLIRRRKQYEVAPPGRYSSERFTYMVSTPNKPGRIIETGEIEGTHFPQGACLEQVPFELISDFRRDPEGAQRDYMGIASEAIAPLIRKRQKIIDATSRGQNLSRLVEKDLVTLAVDGMPAFLPGNFPQGADRDKARWVHVDMSRTGDRCGIAMVRLDGFQDKISEAEMIERLPRFSCELAVGIKPDPSHPIIIADVRSWIMQLAFDFGLYIHAVTFDGFDSRDTIQALRAAGISADVVSMDRSSAPHLQMRDALYEDRLDLQPDCEILAHEMRTLEYHVDKDRIDHPPKFGSKDVVDCLSGALFKAAQSRQVRNGIEIVDRREPGEEGISRRYRIERPQRRERPIRVRPL